MRFYTCTTKYLFAFLLLMLIGGQTAHAQILDTSTPGLRAYWNTNARSADRVGHVDWEQYDLVSQVDQVNFERTAGSFYIGGPTDYFAVRIAGDIEIPADGDWTFRVQSDQSVVLLIDGSPVVVDESGHSGRSRSETITLTAGSHAFEVLYWEGWNNAELIVYWDGPTLSSEQVIPASAFSSPILEPIYDAGGEGLWTYWYHNVRHASNVGQIDWDNPDRVETVQRPSYRYTQGPFELGGSSDYFAARFMGVINVDEAGVWTFDLGSDQSAILLIDGVPVVSDASGHSYRWRSGTIDLREGDHTIEIRYWEGWNNAALHVAWKGPSDSYAQIIPSSAYRPGAGATNLPSGGGLRAYRYDSARGASNIGGVDWTDYDSTETVQNVYWPRTRGAFFTGGPTDYFATRLVGKINFPRSGTWTIGLGSDQSARLYLDGSVVVDDTSGHSFRWKYGSKTVTAGEMDFELQHWEGWNDASLVLTWKGPGDEFESVIPASAFSMNRVDPAIGTGGSGLLVYWVDNARHARKVGQIDWQNYDRTTIESNISWNRTSDPFPGSTIISDLGLESTSSGGQVADYFGLRAVGQLLIPSDGIWTFNLGSDQSAQLYIDGQLVINDDASHSYRWRSGTVNLSAGQHDIEVRYWEGWNEAGLALTWTPPGGVEVIIPASAFSHSESQPDYDAGGGGLRAYWTTNARHASNAGQIDYSNHSHATIVPNIAYRISRDPFDDDTPADYMGLRLLGQIDIPADGTWTFSMGSDQSAVLFIDDEPVVVDASGHSYRWRSGTVDLTEGKHDIELRYWEGWNDAGLHLTWRGPTVPAEIIVPRAAFSLRENESPTETGGGIKAYITSNARHASNAGQIDYAEHTSYEIVDNVAWALSRDAFFVDGPTDYFGLRLISEITIPESGTWTFNLGSDQSAILLINDEPVVVDTSGHSYRWRSGTVDLAQGTHKFEVRYWEGWNTAGLNVTWKRPDAAYEEIIPASAFAVYDPEPAFETGEAALATNWYADTRQDSFSTLDWSSPTKTTIEPRVSWNISRESFQEGVGADYFAMQITGTLIVPQSGEWTFSVGSDQYAKLIINDTTVVDDSWSHSYRWRSGTIDLPAGEHQLVLQYMDGWSNAGLFLSWKGPDDLFEEIIPASAFVPRNSRVKMVQWREISGHRSMVGE